MTVCDDVQIKYTGDGTTVLYTFPFEYEAQSDVKVGFLDDDTNEYVEVAQDDANHPWSFDNATTIRFTTAPTSSEEFKIYRNTTIDYAVFSPGSSIRAQDLNDNFDQIQMAIEEGRCADENIRDYVDENYLKLGGANITTEAEQIAGTVPDDDTHVLSNAASIERHDNIVNPTNPGDQSQEGKLWIDSSTERIQYWNDDINAWVDTSQSGPQGPQGESGTVTVGTTTTSDPGTDAEVTNTGPDESNAIFNFTIPRGDQGPESPQGPQGEPGEGVVFRGQVDATLPNSAPANPETGDLWYNNGDGVVDASWGAPAAGTTVAVGWRLARTVGGTWEALEPVAPVVNDLWEIDDFGILVPIGDQATSLPEELFIGGTSEIPTLRIDPNDSTAGTGFCLPTGNTDTLGVKTDATVRATFNPDGLTVGNTTISNGLINNVGTLDVNVNGDVVISATQTDVVIPTDELSVEGEAAPGFAATITENIVYRVDAVNPGDEADWATFGAVNPQPGQYFAATRSGALPANNNATQILNTADLNVSGDTSIGGDLSVANITFQDGTTINTGGGDANKIEEGNTSAEVVDTGSDGHFKVVTDGTERMRVTNNGYVRFGDGTNYYHTIRGGGGNEALEFTANAGQENASTVGIIKFLNSNAGGAITERMRLDTSGRLIVGATSESESSLFSITGSTGGTGDTASIFLRNGLADGSVAGSYALGRIRFGNAGGECARIDTQSEDSFSSSSRPGRLMFLTTPSGSTTPTERLRINKSGAFGLSGANYGSSGQVLTSRGSGSAPQWQNAPTPSDPAALSTASGSAPSYSARAFVKYNQQSNSVLYSRNVSSVTDNSAGLFTVNLSTGMPTSDHVVVGSCAHDGFGGMALAPNRNSSGFNSPSSSSCIISTTQSNTGNQDCINYVVFFA